MNYFITRLPLTYINAVEAQHYFKVEPEDSILIILYKDIDSDDIRRIKKMLDHSLWSGIYYLPYNVETLQNEREGGEHKSKFINPIGRIKDILNFVNKLNSVANYDGSVERVFIGDYNIVSMRHITNRLKPHEIFILDEGSKVCQIYHQRQREIHNKRWRLLKKNFWKCVFASVLFGYQMQEFKDFSFFSTYDLLSTDKIKVYRNHYSHLKKNINTLDRFPGVFFLGQCKVKHGSMKLAVYIDYLIKIKKWFNNLKIIYIPHVGEEHKHLELIQKETGFKIVEFDVPIEYKLCVDGPIPSVIASFVSSALQNCDNILQGMAKVMAFYIYPDDFIGEGKEVTYEEYKYYETHQSESFSVVKLPTSKHGSGKATI